MLQHETHTHTHIQVSWRHGAARKLEKSIQRNLQFNSCTVAHVTAATPSTTSHPLIGGRQCFVVIAVVVVWRVLLLCKFMSAIFG